MTQYISETEANTNPTRSALSDLVQNGQTLPPFAALDDLDKSVAMLDDWISQFVGRMQPYRSGEVGIKAEPVAQDQGRQLEMSSLERRIYETTLRVHAIREALDEMNEGLHL